MMRKISNSLSFSIKNGVEKIKEECIELRNQVQLATEEGVEQLNEQNHAMIKEINEFEKECIECYQSSKVNDEEAIKAAEELVSFHIEWNEYLNQAQINDKHIAEANEIATKLNEKAEKQKINLDSLIFNGSFRKYTRNQNKLDKSSLGLLELGWVKGIESTILRIKK